MTLASPQLASPVSASVLIVEDEAVVALDLRGELEALGYRVVGIAGSAQQAIELAERHRPQIALMDIMLRGDVDGIALAGRLRREYGTPVIFLTSFSDSETVARAARQGAYGYLTKPFQIKELRAGIEVALWKSQMERQLHEADRWFAQTLRCVQDGVIAVGPDRIIRFMNTAAERLVGQRTEDAAGRSLADVVRFADDDADAGSPSTVSALREGRIEPVRQARMLHGEAGLLPVDQSAGPISDERGEFMGWVLVLRDASERLRQEALLRGSEERFRHAFEFAPLGMAMVTLEGTFMQVNDALCRLLERTPQWLATQTTAAVTHADDIAHESERLGELMRTRDALTQFEKRYLRGEGAEPVWVLVNASLISADGQPACFLYQVHDLTAQRAAAAQLAELADARLKREAGEVAERTRGELLSRISHEMRTPLNAVLGFSQLIQLQHATGQQPSGAYADNILTAGTHLLALVDDVLDLQRATDGSLSLNPSDVRLDDFMTASVGLLEPIAGERAVRLQGPVTSGLCVRADATRLRQILLNVGSNAVKYNVHGGTVSFGVAAGRPGRVEISIRDSGIGMSDEQLGHLYEPFNRLGREALAVSGVGLGLVITRKLVERMAGTMTVQSHVGTGTTVTIDLPRAG